MLAEETLFQRTERLIGSEAMAHLASLHVVVFGVGGVGSWCAESLIRTGIRHLTIVDSDRVCVSNINRQLMATTHTVGQAKVEALKERLLAINPHAEIHALQEVFTATTADQFFPKDPDGHGRTCPYDYIIDAIDSLQDKALLIELACQTKARLFSSMGAAMKMNPTRIQVAEFWKVKGDPLARALRNRFKREKRLPRRKFLCVFSDELLPNLGADTPWSEEQGMFRKAQVNGSLPHITATFGFTLAGLVVQDATSKPDQPAK